MGRTSDARERLLQAALDLIWTHSFSSVGVEQICEQAGVRKGSFYHFFPSKTDLALATYRDHWSSIQPEFDAIFSPLVRPLDRIDRWCEALYQHQKALFDRLGFVCGCPYANVGTELGTLDARIRGLIQEIFDRAQCYLESAIRDLGPTGIKAEDEVRATAQAIHSCELGLLVRAKVANDPEILRELGPSVHRLLGLAVPLGPSVNPPRNLGQTTGRMRPKGERAVKNP
jgi:TetR/AcrR family transcriptional repressor of nem operon